MITFRIGELKVGAGRGLEGVLNQKTIYRAAQQALRKTTKEVKPDIVKGIKARYTYRGAISSKMKARVRGLDAEIVARGRKHTISKFKHSNPSKKKYLTSSVLKGQTDTYRRGFRALGTYFQRLTSKRLPIKAIYGPSVPEMAGHFPEPATTIRGKINEHLGKNLALAFMEAM